MTLRQTAAAPAVRTHRRAPAMTPGTGRFTPAVRTHRGAPAMTPGTGRFAPTARTHRKDRP